MNTKQNWQKRFFTIWVGQAFSLLGSNLVQFALVWWMTQTTGSATVLATASLIATLPGIFLGPFAGALVDRWNRKAVMMIADSLVALVTAGLVVLFWAGSIQLWHVYLALFVRSLGGNFHWTAMQASTSLMVPEDQLSRIAGLNQTLQGILNIAAPPFGAVLLGFLPIHAVLSIDIITAILAVALLALVHVPQPKRAAAATPVTPANLLKDVREGFAYIGRWPGMVALLVMATLINLLVNPAFTLAPLVVTKIFNGGALEVGLTESAWGIGMIAGGVLLSVWGGFKKKIYTSLLGIVGLGLSTVLAGASPSNMFWLLIAAFVITGVMNPITNGPLFALLQSRIAPEMQGRVFTLVNSLASAMTPIGLLLSAPVADHFGLRVWFLVGGSLCALMGAAAFFVSSITHLEEDIAPITAAEAAAAD